MLKHLVTKDNLRIAYYEYSKCISMSNSGSVARTPILFSHATGFHGRVFDSTIGSLQSKYSCFSMDHRGHGRSGWNSTVPLHWSVFASDALDVGLACCGSEKVVGVGHSMGAAALLMAALLEPCKFSALILYEPIIFPFEMRMLLSALPEAPLAVVAKKRRSKFSSLEEAVQNFSRKAPMNAFSPEVLRDFVVHGLAPKPELAYSDPTAETSAPRQSTTSSSGELHDGDDNSLYLRCFKEIEAEVYNSATHHNTWDELGKLTVPTLVMAGEYKISQPSFFAERLAKRIPGASFVRWSENSHFGPMENPVAFAECVDDFVSKK